jgi:periplasmic divalent cation tolerance protein
MSDYKLFYMTCKNKVEANKIAYALVKKKDLVACANIIPNIKSYFKWNKRKINIVNESILIGKTVKKNINKIIVHVKKISSYECPCIVFVDIKNGNKDFLRWIKSSTK